LEDKANTGEASKVAVVGLGSMGFGMASSLLRAGFPVAGCDVSEVAVKRFSQAGGAGAASPAEAARDASALVTVVVNAAQTERVLFGPEGAAATLRPGGVIVSCATLAPETARRLAKMAAERGLAYLDAPISGGARRAAEGGLTILASGPKEAFEAARPLLDAMAQKVYELGDEAGIGSAFKIVNQLLAGVHIAAASEAMTFAKRLGLDLDMVYEVITKSAGNSWMFEDRMAHVLEGDYSPRSAVDIFTKDLGIVSDISRDTRFPTPIAATALQMFLMTASAGMGADDDSSVARLYARTAGLKLPGDG
jgi:3-hydroxyisobutyrate dehydrogenase